MCFHIGRAKLNGVLNVKPHAANLTRVNPLLRMNNHEQNIYIKIAKNYGFQIFIKKNITNPTTDRYSEELEAKQIKIPVGRTNNVY